MDILLVSYGSTGDVRPFLALGLALRARGQRVRICAPPDSERIFADRGLPFFPLGRSVRHLMANRADQLVARPLAAMAPMTRELRKELVTQFKTLSAFARTADLIIGGGLAIAVPSVAEACGIPYRYAVGIPALLPSRCHAPITLPWQNLPAFGNLILWRLAGTLLDWGYRSLLNRHRRLLGLHPIPHMMPHLTANLIIAADKELAPLPSEAPLDCWQTGYWHPPSNDRLPTEVVRFLDGGDPPIYIGFGSMGDPAPQETIALLRRAVQWAGVRAIIQSGWAGWHFESDADCLGVTDELSHDHLFTRVAATVHHGGVGTVMTAARAGVPQLIVPHLLDQYYWGRRIWELGLGPRPVPKNRLSAEGLSQILDRMITTRTMRAKARKLSHLLRHRDGARQAADLILNRIGN